MTRPLRIEYPDAVYHITARGNGRQEIFHDEQDYRKFLDLLGKTVSRFNWACHAFCLMGNHYHLMIETPDANISKGMHHLNGSFSQAHHKRYDTVGHLFQGRFKAIVVDRESYLLELARYVVLNPVRAGLVANPEDWPWSSYRAMVGLPCREGWETEEGGAAGKVKKAVAVEAGAATEAPAAASSPATSFTPVAAASAAMATAAAGSTVLVGGLGTATAAESEGSAGSGTARTSAGVAPAPAALTSMDWLLGQFGPDLGPDRAAARQRYRDFVAAGIGRESPWRQLKSQLFLGKETFIENLKLKDVIPEKTAMREITKQQRYANRPPLQEIFGSWLDNTRLDKMRSDNARRDKAGSGKMRRDKRPPDKKRRDEAIFAGNVTYGYDQKEIADFLGLHYTTVSLAIKRQEARQEAREEARAQSKSQTQAQTQPNY